MKYKHFSKRGLALIVSLMMCLSAMSTTAWAGNFKDLQNLIDTSDGNVVLGENYSYDASTDGDKKGITVNKDTNLNLNGWTIEGSDQESVIKVSGNDTDLTIRNEKDDATESNTDENGELVIGQITGGSAKNGGGVHVSDGATFTLESGAISGNNATANTPHDKGTGGAGVYVHNGTFVMNGGEISNNTAYRDAAGVELDDKATFVMNGGTITGNETSKNGGGVSVKGNGATFEMNGGTITGNIAKGSGSNISGSEQKVTLNGGTVTKDDYDNYGKGACHELQDDGTCKVGHQKVSVDKVDATCTEDGHEAGQKCANCEATTGLKTIPALKHAWGEGVVTAKPTTTSPGVKTFTCTRESCGATRTEEIPVLEPTDPDPVDPDPVDPDPVDPDPVDPDPVDPDPVDPDPVDPDPVDPDPVDPDPVDPDPVDPDPVDPDPVDPDPVDPDPVDPDPVDPDIPVLPETPELPDDGPDVPDDVVTIPDEDVPLGGEPAAAPVTIADEAVPLAGLLSLAQLLDELYRHEDRPAVDLPEGFPFASHEYAPAICWALDSALVVNTEDDPLDPDELLTVGLLRKVLTNYALLKGQEDFVVELTGEDDDLVLDLGERLTVFYAQLEAAE